MNDPQCKAFGDCSLADAGLADQDRIVFGAAREHLDHPANLFIATDHGVELARLGLLDQVYAVLFE